MTENTRQKPSIIKELETQVAAAADTRQKIDAMNALAWALRESDAQRTISLSNEVRFLASTGEFRDQPYRRGLALSLRNLGYGYLQLSSYAQALSYLGGALSLFEALDDDKAQVLILNTLGQTYCYLGDYSAGLDCYLKALHHAKPSNDFGTEFARSLKGIGQVYARLQKYAEAKDYFLRSLQRYRHLGARSEEAEILSSLGYLSRDREKYQEALDYFHQCWRVAGETDNKVEAVRAALSLGAVYHKRHNLEDALDYLHRALAISQEIEAKAQQGECHQRLATIYKENGDFEKALNHYEQFYGLKELVFNQEADDRLRSLEMIHRVETAQKEAEIYQLRNVELEQEITERKQLETELRASEEKYRHVVENSNDGIAIVQDGRVKFTNAQMKSITGYSLAELQATTFNMFLVPEERKKVASFHRQRLLGKKVPARYETRLVRKNGAPVDLEISTSLVTYESKPAVLGFVRDITEQKQVEAAIRRLNDELEQRVAERTQALLAEIREREAAEHSLRESEARFRRVITSISAHIYMTEITAEGERINLYLSPNVEILTGYPWKNFMQDWNFWPNQVIHPEDQVIATAHALHLDLEQGDEIEYRLIRADGRTIWVRDSARVEQGSGSKIVYGVVTDITERKQAEEEKERQRDVLRQYAQRLEVLHLVSSSFNEARTRQQVAQALLVTTMGITETDHGAILLVNGKTLIPVLSMDAGSETVEPQPDLPEALLWTIIQEEESRFISDPAGQEPELGLQKVASVAVIPLKAMGMVVGILHLSYQQRHPFSEEEMRLLTIICDIGGNALHRNIVLETLEQRVADRTRELVALYDVTVLASGTQALAKVLEQSLEKVLEAGRCDATCIYLLDDDQKNLQLIAQASLPADTGLSKANFPTHPHGAEWILSWNHKLIMAPDLTTDQNVPPEMRLPGFRSYLGVPMRVKGRALGLLNLFWRSTRHLALEEVVLLSTMADQMGVAVEIARLRQRVATTAVVEERQRLVRELHDSVTQSMYSQTLFARSARDALEDGEIEKLEDTLIRMDENALHTLKEMRLLLYELRPSILEQEGLVQALNTRLGIVERRVGVKVQLQVDGPLELPKQVEVELYRIAIEALNNTLKHAQASQISIYLRGEGDRIRLEITDDGQGFAPETLGQGGIGLKSMRERAERLGGQLTVTATPGSGTKVILEMTR